MHVCVFSCFEHEISQTISKLCGEEKKEKKEEGEKCEQYMIHSNYLHAGIVFVFLFVL